jgi:hypothetical protein
VVGKSPVIVNLDPVLAEHAVNFIDAGIAAGDGHHPDLVEDGAPGPHVRDRKCNSPEGAVAPAAW